MMKNYLIVRKKEKQENIVESEFILAPIEWVYNSLTISDWIDEWGGGPSRFSNKIGGKYFFWDGEVYGTIVDLKKFEKIIFTFREIDWKEEWKDSIVIIDLKAERNGTRLNLQHSLLPDIKIRKKHEINWGECYLGPIKAYVENRFYLFQKNSQKSV